MTGHRTSNVQRKEIAKVNSHDERVAVERIGPAKAGALLESQSKNRTLGTKKVGEYASDMAGGRWRDRCSTIHIDWNGELIDGQHRLHAVIQSGLPQVFIVSREHDPDDQFFLDNGKNRTTAQQMGLKDVELPERQSTVARNALAYATGAMQKSPGNRGGGDYPGRAATLDYHAENEEAILWAVKLIDVKSAKRTAFSAGSLNTAAFLIAQVSTRDAVEDFFDEWLNPGRAIKGRAIWRLNDLGVATFASAPAPAQVGALLRSWNSHRRGRSGGVVRLKTQIDPGAGPHFQRAEQWIPFPDEILP